eukprot:2018649-Prymnesium_polylepis.1
MSRECTGPCIAGHFCVEGSTRNASGVCREARPNLNWACPMPLAAAGRYYGDIGGTSAASCSASPRGNHVPAAGSTRAIPCAPGARLTN